MRYPSIRNRGFMYNPNSFTPIGGQTIRHAPTVFSYKTDDTLKDVFSAGYFDKNAIMFSPGDKITAVCSDKIAEIFVKAIEGLRVVLDERVILAGPIQSKGVPVEEADITPVKKKTTKNTKKAA